MVTKGWAPACANTMSARASRPADCGTRKRARSSGSATVADRPTVVSCGAKREQPRQTKRQQIAALRRHQRMQFVEHHAAEAVEQIRRVGRRQQQRELLRRGEQNVGRIAALTLALGGGRVAGAGLQPHGQAHFPDRNFQVARDVDRQRLERRDIEGVQALRAADLASGREQPARRSGRFVQFHQRRQKAGQRLAAAGGRDQQRRAPLPRLGQKFELMRARRPAAAGEPAGEHVRQ